MKKSSTNQFPGSDDDGIKIDLPFLPNLDLLNCLPTAVVIVDASANDLPLSFVNDAFLKTTGYTRKEVLGRNCRFLQGPDTSVEAINELRDCLTRKVPYNGVLLNYKKNGESFWNQLTIAPVESNDGHLLYYIGVQIDISWKREAERKLRSEQDLNSKIMETSVVAITTLNPDGEITFANQQAQHVLGLSFDEIKKRTYNDPKWRITSIDGSPYPDSELPFVKVMQTGEPVFDIRHAIIWPSGKRKFLSINGAPIFDDNNQISLMVFLVSDVTELIEFQRKLEESEKRFRRLAESAPVKMWMSMDGIYRNYFNERWIATTGRDIDSEKGKGWLDHVHPDDLDRLLTTIKTAVEQKTRYEVEYRLKTSNNYYIHLLERGQPRSTDPGESHGYIGSAINITSVKKAENERLEFNKRVLKMHRLKNVALMSSKMSNSFHSILDSIISNLEEIRHNPDDCEKCKKLIDEAKDSVYFGQNICKQINMFTGGTNLVKQNTNLNTLLKEIRPLIETYIPPSCSLSLKLSSHPPSVNLDVTEIRQVIFNLISNSVEFLPPNDPTIVITSGSRIILKNEIMIVITNEYLPAGNYAVLQVEDNGSGIDPANSSNVFEPFFTTTAGGQGLGLPASLGTVVAHGGTMYYETHPTKNTTIFTVLLPEA
jgi:PAS domain S-box-containing protein